jgi:hypothetical protein
MKFLRIGGAIACLVMAGGLLLHVGLLFQPLIIPLLRQLRGEKTHFVFMHVEILGLSLSGSQILMFEGALLCFGIVLMLAAFHLFRSPETEE